MDEKQLDEKQRIKNKIDKNIESHRGSLIIGAKVPGDEPSFLTASVESMEDSDTAQLVAAALVGEIVRGADRQEILREFIQKYRAKADSFLASKKER